MIVKYDNYDNINAMQKKLIDSIQNDFFKLTNIKLSKKKIEKKILPIFFYIYNSKGKKFLISGSQGIGKTTILEILNRNFHKFFGKKILSLSLDDFYYDKAKREILSKNIHPLLRTRGVPGTHNTKEILNVIKKFNKSEYPVKVSIFDKLKDSRRKKQRIINGKTDIIILEGWCCGSPPINKKYLQKNINILEKRFDKKLIWRNFYNNKLKNEYSELFKKFDKLIYFKAPNFSHVFDWRLKQEKNMNITKNSKQGMNKKEIAEFIQHYEKVTKWMMKVLPTKADLTVYINTNQNIKKISIS
jgi:D-glycerate 3-kinase